LVKKVWRNDTQKSTKSHKTEKKEKRRKKEKERLHLKKHRESRGKEK
jgi:hypothetical protein